MKEKMSKQPPPAPTASAVGPCPTVIQTVGRPGTGSLPSTIAPPDHPLCAERRDLKKKRYDAEGAKEYREANRRVQKAVKKAKEDRIGAQREETETCLNKNTARDLTSEKQGRSSTIQDKSWICLTKEKEILSRWTEYCSELYNYESCGDNAVLDCSQPPVGCFWFNGPLRQCFSLYREKEERKDR